MNRIVVDTNVLIDGVQDEHSAAWQIVQSVIDGKIEGLLSDPVKREYNRIVTREIVNKEYKQRLRDFFSACKHIKLHSVPRVIADDSDDDKILATAEQGNADCIVSSDHHLLNLDPYEALRIMKPQEYLHKWKDEHQSEWDKFANMIGLNTPSSSEYEI